jgi:hypothetical protein
MIVRNGILKKITLFAGICMMHHAQAQTTYKEVNIAPPNAASLGKHVDVPVSYHTGMPQIGLPIYTVTEGPLSLPIGLSYHPGGLKVAEPASWVGAGWSLQAGGVISRTVVGQPDERFGQGNGVQTHGHFSDYGFNNYMVPPGATQTDDAAFRDGRKDGEPDLFFFNFAGYSGKFYFHDDRTAVLVPEQDIKITPVYPANGQTINSFIITTPDGVKYYFGRTDITSDVDPIEISAPYSSSVGMINSQLISAWYLNKVVSPDGNFSITLSYVEEKYGYHTLSSFPKAFNDPEPDKEYNVVKTYLKGVRLSQIFFSAGRVNFVADHVRQDVNSYNIPQGLEDYANTEARALTGISITNNTNFCRQYDLSYGYFEDNNTSLASGINNIAGAFNITTDKKRLKLNQVREKACNGTIELPPTVFDYETELVPRRLSLGSDFWGFINGQNSNQQMIATHTVNKFTTVNGANRDPAWPAMRGGTLKKITYPTGGNTTFEFEPNKVWLSYLKYNETYRFDFSMGYDGNQWPVSRTDVYSGNPYKFIVTNSAAGGNAYLQPMGLEVLPGQTKEVIWQPVAGSQTITLNKLNASSGNGVSATCKEMIPYQYQNNDIVGGLRIKTITQNDATTTTPIVTNYNYEVNGQSSGKLYGRPVVVQVIRHEYFKGEYGLPGTFSIDGCIVSPSVMYYKSGGSVRPMENSQGNHIGYNEVKVSKTGNGHAIYRYYGSNVWENNLNDIAIRNVDLQCDATIPLYPPPPQQFEPKRGELKYEGYFNDNGQMISEKQYNYAYTENPVKTPGYATERHLGFSNNMIVLYDLSTWKKTQTTVTETQRDPATGNTMLNTLTTDYASNYHTQPTQTGTSNSNSQPLLAKMKYAYDYQPLACQLVVPCNPDYVTAANNAYNSYLATRAACGTAACKYSAIINYRMNLASIRQTYLGCRAQRFNNTNSDFNNALNNALTNADAGLKPVLEMYNRGMNTVVESSNWKNSLLMDAMYNQFQLKPYSGYDAIEITKTSKLSLQTPSATFTPTAISGNSLAADSRYKEEVQVTMNKENLQEIKKNNGIKNSYIWDETNNHTLAVVVNAQAADVAFTSFEANASGGFSYALIGGFTAAYKITGKRAYFLSQGVVTKGGLTSGTQYIVTCWLLSGSGTVQVNGAGGTLMRSLPNGWQQYQFSFTGNTTATISGTGTIDELRLYPKGAVMSSYTYEPLVGLTSQNDANNRISFYEYDQLGRLGIIRDMQGNIIKKMCYRYNGQTDDCTTNPSLTVYSNAQLIRYYCRDNCPAGTIPDCYTLTVPAGTYTSTTTQADADAQALEYANTTGQIYINTNGNCVTCSGVDKKIVNGICETGVKVVTYSFYDEGWWYCTYHYEFSDYTQTQDFTYSGPDPCE